MVSGPTPSARAAMLAAVARTAAIANVAMARSRFHPNTLAVGLLMRLSLLWHQSSLYDLRTKAALLRYCSSGGLTCWNWIRSRMSYTILSVPQMSSGHPRFDAAYKAPARTGLAAEARLRGTIVKLAAAARSGGVTTAIT